MKYSFKNQNYRSWSIILYNSNLLVLDTVLYCIAAGGNSFNYFLEAILSSSVVFLFCLDCYCLHIVVVCSCLVIIYIFSTLLIVFCLFYYKAVHTHFLLWIAKGNIVGLLWLSLVIVTCQVSFCFVLSVCVLHISNQNCFCWHFAEAEIG